MALLLLSLAFTWTASQSKIVWEDVCQVGAFSPSCSVGESIVIKAALWGRMKLGKCAQREYGQIGCSNDVSNYLDDMCSGKSTCIVKIPNTKFEQFKTCDSHHLKNYLQVGYECIKDYELECSNTYSGLNGTLFLQNARIWSSCSFSIKAQVGQFINIIIHDFGETTTSPDNSIYFIESDSLTVVEHLNGNKKSYKTLSESIKITLNVDFRKMPRTFIYYEVKGCPKLKPPVGAEIKFLESDKRAEIFCKSNNFIRSTLICEDNNWQGLPVNCSQSLQHADGAALNVFQRTLMICTIVVSLSVAFVLPVIVLVYLRGRLYPSRKPPDDNSVRNNDGNDYYFKVEMNDLDFPLRSVEAPPDLLFGRSNSNYSSYHITDGNYSFSVADDL